MEKIIKYFTREYKEFYQTLLLRYEIEDLKQYLRALERKEEVPKVACFFSSILPLTVINYQKLQI